MILTADMLESHSRAQKTQSLAKFQYKARSIKWPVWLASRSR